MTKGEKVNTEQFNILNRRFDDLSCKVGDLEKDVNSKFSTLEKDVSSKFSTLEKEMGYKTDMLKWGILALLGLGLFKSCGDGTQQNKQSYVQPAPQIYVITPQDNESYKIQLESLQEKLKIVEEKYKGEK